MFRKNIVMVLQFLFYRPILISFHTNVKYVNILNKLAFNHCMSKVKVRVAIFVIALGPLFIDRVWYLLHANVLF